jgi:hypothetical protein
MESIFKTWKTSRNLCLNILNNLTLEQLNKIPNGFNNNLIWHIGHIVVVQQLLIYKCSNLNGYVSDELFELYKPHTKPTGLTTEIEVEELKTLLLYLIEQTETDFYNGKFIAYNERTTGTGFHLNSLLDAFEFNNYHEGLHLGYMLSIKKFI